MMIEASKTGLSWSISIGKRLTGQTELSSR
jgi:hypothetical protein